MNEHSFNIRAKAKVIACAALALLGCAGGSPAAGGDTSPPAADSAPPPGLPRDAGPLVADSTGWPDAAAPVADVGVIPDTRSTGGPGCVGILACLGGCGNDAGCVTQCLQLGSPADQAEAQALIVCADAAAKGLCAASCSDTGSKVCQDCVLAACQAEQLACQLEGDTIEGFGSPCDPNTTPSTCPWGQACVGSAAGEGFCSLSCAALGAECSGAPSGTAAGCILSSPAGKLYCGFLCQAKDDQGASHQFACPGGMSCATKEDPPGQRSCVP